MPRHRWHTPTDFRWELSAQVRSTVERAGSGRTCRGRPAGKRVKTRRHCIAHSETSDGEIPVVSTTCRRRSNSSSGRVGDRDRRDGVLRRVTTHSTTTDKPVNGEQPLTRSSVDYRPSIYAINAAAITEPHAVQQLSADINSYNVDFIATNTRTVWSPSRATHSSVGWRRGVVVSGVRQ